MMLKSTVYNIVVLVMFFIISWKMTLFTLAIMIPSLCFSPLYGGYMRKMNKKISDGKAASSNVAEEAFSNIRTVKAFATEDVECIEYAKANDEVLENAKKAANAYGCF
jgi:ABC-type multidrug transport system fused ATPase/permease subunit